MKLSIIIPYYNAEPYTSELLERLEPQITDDVEVLVIDDGSTVPFKTGHPWVKVIRQSNGGVSRARNVGLDKATGDYVSFIDADDLVSENYVRNILDKADTEHFDYLEMSWKSLGGGMQCGCKLNSDSDRLHNPSVCTRAYRKAFIGDLRFNEKKDSAEDEEFSRKMTYEGGKRSIITDYTYFYRTSVLDSKTKKYMAGELNTKRILYFYNAITTDMQYLVDEVKEEDEYNEVIILTNRCDIPELRKYAQIWSPQSVRGHELRGEPNNHLHKIEAPIKTQIVIWTGRMPEIGGIYTFTYNFCMAMKDYYDIVVLYSEMNPKQIEKLEPYVQMVSYNPHRKITCDVLILNRLREVIPTNIQYGKSIQMCHTCKIDPLFRIPQSVDAVVCVSEASKASFGKEADKGIVIHNLSPETDNKRALMLVSATRLDTFEKGKERIRFLANLMNIRGIPYIWLCFSNVKLDDMPDNFINMPFTMDIRPYIAMADYLVQLSSEEGFCYSIVEALQCGTPVLTTKLNVLSEIGFKEGENGYIVPFDLTDDFDIEKIYNKPIGKFQYSYDNKSIIEQWRAILGDLKPTHNYRYRKKVMVNTRVIMKYRDQVLNTQLMPNTELPMERDRAYYLKHKGYVEILGET